MAKLTQKYETVIILNTKISEENFEALKTKINDLIEKNATIDSTDVWGKRRLAYPIQDETDGFYILYKYTSEPSFPAELDRVLKITDGVLRSLITMSKD